MVWFSTKKLWFKMKESKIVVADRGRKHFIVPVSLHHTLQFFFIFFSTGISPVVFKSSTSTYPNYQPPLLLENQTWPLFEILKHWEILIRSVIKDFNSRLLCPPPALNGKVLKISKYRPNHICNALPYFLFKLWLPLLPPTKDICKMIMLCQISELCLSFCWKAIPGGKNKK